MVRWEYYSDEDLSTYSLNKLGLEGWELVSAYVVERSYSKDRVYIFKRRYRKGKEIASV